MSEKKKKKKAPIRDPHEKETPAKDPKPKKPPIEEPPIVRKGPEIREPGDERVRIS